MKLEKDQLIRDGQMEEDHVTFSAIVANAPGLKNMEYKYFIHNADDEERLPEPLYKDRAITRRVTPSTRNLYVIDTFGVPSHVTYKAYNSTNKGAKGPAAPLPLSSLTSIHHYYIQSYSDA